MKETIDKAETLNIIRSFISSLRPDTTGLITDIYDAVLHITPADPVKHGHWKERTMLNNFTGKWQRMYMCSKCRHTQLTISAFCGGCGARMEGAEHD